MAHNNVEIFREGCKTACGICAASGAERRVFDNSGLSLSPVYESSRRYVRDDCSQLQRSEAWSKFVHYQKNVESSAGQIKTSCDGRNRCNRWGNYARYYEGNSDKAQYIRGRFWRDHSRSRIRFKRCLNALGFFRIGDILKNSWENLSVKKSLVKAWNNNLHLVLMLFVRHCCGLIIGFPFNRWTEVFVTNKES